VQPHDNFTQFHDPMSTDHEETAEPTVADSTGVARIRQPHGGALLAGGVKGNKGGRTPAALRNICRNEFATLIPKIKRLTQTKRDEEGKVLSEPDARILLKAAELFAKFGMDAAISVTDAKRALRATKAEIDEYLPAEQAEMLWNRIMSHWVKI
jgi:hypothetical protein